MNALAFVSKGQPVIATESHLPLSAQLKELRTDYRARPGWQQINSLNRESIRTAANAVRLGRTLAARMGTLRTERRVSREEYQSALGTHPVLQKLRRIRSRRWIDSRQCSIRYAMRRETA